MNMQEKSQNEDTRTGNKAPLRDPAEKKSVTEKLEALSPTAFDSLLESEAAKKFFHKRTLASPLIVPFVRGGRCYEDSLPISGKDGTPAYGIQPKVAPGGGDSPGGDAA
jgi:hypothetical protein